MVAATASAVTVAIEGSLRVRLLLLLLLLLLRGGMVGGLRVRERGGGE